MFVKRAGLSKMHLRSSANVKSSGSLTFAFIQVTSHLKHCSSRSLGCLPKASRTSRSVISDRILLTYGLGGVREFVDKSATSAASPDDVNFQADDQVSPASRRPNRPTILDLSYLFLGRAGQIQHICVKLVGVSANNMIYCSLQFFFFFS